MVRVRVPLLAWLALVGTASARRCRLEVLQEDPAGIADQQPCTTADFVGAGMHWGTLQALDLHKVLLRHKHVRAIDLTYNTVGGRGAAIAIEAAASDAAMGGIAALDVSHNGVDDDGAQRLARALAPASGPGLELEVLHLEHNNIGSAGAAALFAALRSGPSASTLRVLNLGNNRLSDVGAEAAAASLVAPPPETPLGAGAGWLVQIERMQLADNNISARGVEALAAGIASRAAAPSPAPVLRSLTLDYNEAIGDAGAAAFAPLLRAGGHGLQQIGLSGTGIGDATAVLFASALLETAGGGRVQSLQELMMAHSHIGTPGAAELLRAAEAQGSTLAAVVLVGNMKGIDGAVSRQLRNALRYRNNEASAEKEMRILQWEDGAAERRLAQQRRWRLRSERCAARVAPAKDQASPVPLDAAAVV